MCANAHVDKHVVNMILEYAQLLSTAHRVLDEQLSTDLDSVIKQRAAFRFVIDTKE